LYSGRIVWVQRHVLLDTSPARDHLPPPGTRSTLDWIRRTESFGISPSDGRARRLKVRSRSGPSPSRRAIHQSRKPQPMPLHRIGGGRDLRTARLRRLGISGSRRLGRLIPRRAGLVSFAVSVAVTLLSGLSGSAGQAGSASSSVGSCARTGGPCFSRRDRGRASLVARGQVGRRRTARPKSAAGPLRSTPRLSVVVVLQEPRAISSGVGIVPAAPSAQRGRRRKDRDQERDLRCERGLHREVSRNVRFAPARRDAHEERCCRRADPDARPRHPFG
jgi:hypothetical protein